jgi:hypothetical protein
MVIPVARPITLDCIPAVYPLLQTSLLLIITFGAFAVGGILSIVVVPVMVFVPVIVDVTVFVSAAKVTL